MLCWSTWGLSAIPTRRGSSASMPMAVRSCRSSRALPAETVTLRASSEAQIAGRWWFPNPVYEGSALFSVSTTTQSQPSTHRPALPGPTGRADRLPARRCATAISVRGMLCGATTVPSGLIDWDYAYPGDPFDDVAYALEYRAPFRADDQATRWLRHQHPPDRRRRIEIILDAYGTLEDVPISRVIDRVIARQMLSVHQVEVLAGRGLQPQASWVATGYLDQLRQQIRWSEEHRDLPDP